MHVILYSFNLPVEPLDPRPSVKVVAMIIIAAFLTLQLSFLRGSFLQQIRDSKIIHREVLHEYDKLLRQGNDRGTQVPVCVVEAIWLPK